MFDWPSAHAEAILALKPVFSPTAFGAVLQGSLFGLVGLLPQKYSAIFMSGQGLAGTFAAVAMLLAIGSKSDPSCLVTDKYACDASCLHINFAVRVPRG